jgi:ribosomal protein S18 acetylase RimI-like enzyme
MSHETDKTEKIGLRPVQDVDEALLYRLYASTRMDELAQVPWTEAQLDAFLKMQFDMQKRGYRMQFPAADHSIILSGEREIGRLLINRTDDELLLVDITLLPEFRGRGIGGSLLRELQNEATGEGKSVRLSVIPTNPARRLYERAGFSQVGESGGLHLDMLWQPQS